MNNLVIDQSFKDCVVLCQPGSLYERCTFLKVILVHYAADNRPVTFRECHLDRCEFVEFLDYLEREASNGLNIRV